MAALLILVNAQAPGTGIGPPNELIEGRKQDPQKPASEATDSDTTRKESAAPVCQEPRSDAAGAGNDRS